MEYLKRCHYRDLKLQSVQQFRFKEGTSGPFSTRVPAVVWSGRGSFICNALLLIPFSVFLLVTHDQLSSATPDVLSKRVPVRAESAVAALSGAARLTVQGQRGLTND